MKKIKNQIFILLISFFFSTMLLAQSTNDCDLFISEVNQEWQARNYTNILTAIDQRLTTESNDVLALALKVGYYTWAEVSFSNVQSSANAFLIAVTNVAPAEFQDPSALVNYAMAIASMPMPTNAPVNESRTAQQVDYVHQTYPLHFPDIEQAIFLDSRIDPDQ